MAQTCHLFVYGSFCEGLVHYDRIAQFVRSSRPASIKGSAYRLQVGFPVYLSDGDDLISGQLVELEGPDVFFNILDEFHGFSPVNPEKSLFWKADAKARLEDESEQECWVYALNPAKLPKSAESIPFGDWRESLKRAPALTDTLTERQLTYVKKLGSTSGREIVPIDLDLYRELMKLDLIVDKGRRLALSRLGREVFRFLA